MFKVCLRVEITYFSARRLGWVLSRPCLKHVHVHLHAYFTYFNNFPLSLKSIRFSSDRWERSQFLTRKFSYIFSGRKRCSDYPGARDHRTDREVSARADARQVTRADCNHALAWPRVLDGATRHRQDFHGHSECSRRRRGQYCSTAQRN